MDAPEAQHELDAPPWRRVESTLMATSRALRRAYDLRLRDLGLNLSEAICLAFVDERGPLTQARIADGIGMNRASAGAVVEVLLARGLVRRDPDEADRRVWLVAVTEAGAELAVDVRAVDRALRDDLRSGIPKADRQQLARLLVQLQGNLAGILAEGA